MSPIPIIGMGAVCAAGSGVDNAFETIAGGADGLVPLSLFDSGLKQVPLVGQCSLEPAALTNAPDRTTALALAAARQAMAPAANRGGLRLGLVLATTVAGMTRSEIFYRELRTNPGHAKHAALELAHHEPTATSGSVAADIGAMGFHTLSTACSTGLHAIGMAKRLIEQGIYDLCLAVGADAFSLLTVRGFASLMLIDFGGCKPFDKRRVGISLGEGAGALLLASDKAAQTLGAQRLAYAAGWGASADCHHMTAPHPEGAGARAAVEKALAEAGATPTDIGFIAAHGTATPDNDLSEIKAMRAVFDALPPFCSMKRTLGHTLAASGTLEAVFCAEALRRGVIPATAGFEQVDEAIGSRPSPRTRSNVRHVLKNSFGFGGNNAALVLSKA